MMNAIDFKILDCLFFGNIRGISFYSETNFPSPLTIYGCLGKSILEKTNTLLKKGTQHPILGKYCNDLSLENCHLKILGPILAANNSLKWFAPANLYARQDGRSAQLLKPCENNAEYFSDLPDDIQFLHCPGSELEEVKGWVTEEEMKRILCGEIGNSITSQSSFGSTNQRFGHAINPDTGNVIESMFYSKEVTDLARNNNADFGKFHFAVRGNINFLLPGITWEEYKKHCKQQDWLVLPIDETTIEITRNDVAYSLKYNTSENKVFATMNIDVLARLGGEGYQSRIVTRQNEYNFTCPQRVRENIFIEKKFVLYFATPTIFKNGWLPGKWRFQKTIKPCVLKAAAMKKPEFVSGYRIEDHHKSMKGIERSIYRQVPAGAVYFFEANTWEKADFDILVNNIHAQQSQSEIYPAAGFGMPLIGLWPR